MFGVAAHGLLVGGLAPTLERLWLSQRIAADLSRASPNGFEKGPPAVAGYEEPSLVFALGSPTELGDAEDAAAAVNEGRPAVVAGREDKAFRAAVAQGEISARVAATEAGLDYSTGHAQLLRLYEPVPPSPAPMPKDQPPAQSNAAQSNPAQSNQVQSNQVQAPEGSPPQGSPPQGLPP